MASGEKRHGWNAESPQPCGLATIDSPRCIGAQSDTINRAARTPPHRLSTFCGERMNQFSERRGGERSRALRPNGRRSDPNTTRPPRLGRRPRGWPHLRSNPRVTHFPASLIDSFRLEHERNSASRARVPGFKVGATDDGWRLWPVAPVSTQHCFACPGWVKTRLDRLSFNSVQKEASR